MQVRKLGLVLFALGIVFMHVFMTLNFWLIMLKIVPAKTLFGIVSATSLLGSLTWGLGPPVGAVLMVIGGLVYWRKTKNLSEKSVD